MADTQAETARRQRHRRYRDEGWWDGRTLHGVFAEAAAAVPARTALVDPPNRMDLTGEPPRRLSYRDTWNAALNLAADLGAAGIGHGDRVLVQLPNIAEFALAYLALSRLGATISPAPMQYGRHEITYAARELGAKAYIGIGRFRGTDPGALTAELPATVRRMAFNAANGSGFEALTVNLAAPQDPAPALGTAEDIFTIAWTSGTTGTPKGVPRHHGHWFCQAIAVQDAAPLDDGAVMLNPFPLTNMAALSGFFYNWPVLRATLVLHQPFDLPVFLRQIVEEHVVYTIAPPAVLNLFLQREELHGRVDLSKVRYIASGSAPLAPWMVAGFKDKFGVEIINFFGSNEGIGFVGGPADVPDPTLRAGLFPRFGRPDFAWANRFNDYYESKLVDWSEGDREITAAGETGEMLVRGPNVFDGYLNDAGGDEVFDAAGFFRTGDLFQIAGDGELRRFYRFVGRRKELIIRGGVNISPEELDTLLAAHPHIAEAAVCAYPDAVMGEKVCLFAVAKPGQSLTLESVKAFLADQGVAKFKWPERIELIEALPRNALNKVVRGDLQARLGEPARRSPTAE